METWRRSFSALSALVLLTIIGCGPGRGSLGGSVSLQGKPLQRGTVTVVGGDGLPKSSLIKDDGTYLIPDIQAGDVKASVTSPDPGKSIPSQRIPGGPKPKVDRTGWFPIPEKYTDFAKSELAYTVKGGQNTWNIELK